MFARKPKICFVFRYVNYLRFKKTADHTDTYVIILRKSFSLIGSDFSGKFKFKIEKVYYLSSYSLFYTTFNLELKIRAFFSFRLCLGFWTTMRFHKNLRSDTNFKIVYSEHLLWVDIPAAIEMIIVSGESWPGSVLDAASFHSLGFVTKCIYIKC